MCGSGKNFPLPAKQLGFDNCQSVRYDVTTSQAIGTAKQGETMETKEIGNGITVESDAMHGVVRINGKKVKTFHGETAWMDAERYAMDLWFASGR